MSKRHARILLAVSAAALTAAFGTSAAVAATTWTVRPGGPVQAASSNAGITDTKSHNPLPTICNSSITATLKRGRGLPGSGIGSLTSVNFTHCLWVLGLTVTMKPANLPWHLNALSYDSSTGTTHGTVTGIHLAISTASCLAVVDGTGPSQDDGRSDVTYINSTGELTFLNTGGNLHFYRVSGCAGLVASGDPVVLHATYSVTPTQTITSP